MRILHTNFLHGWGGQSNRILNVSRGLVERGHRVLIAAPGDSELTRRARAAGVEVDGDFEFRRGFRPRATLRDLRRMRRLLAPQPFDILHTHGSQDSWIVALADFSRHVPVVRTKHNIFPIRDHMANRWLYGRVFDRIIGISDAIVQQCAAKPYIRRRPALVHSAVDVDRYAQPDAAGVEAWRAQWAARRPVVLTVGRLRSEKGHAFLFESIAQLRGDFPRLLLVVAGDGSLRNELEARVRSLGAADHVQFVGFRADVPELLAAADLFVLPSLSEGLGTAAIEAAAAGRPIVASRVGGIPDVIQEGVTGRLVEPGDSESLARAMAEVLADHSLAERLGRAARQFALEHFPVVKLVGQTEAVYLELLADRAPHRGKDGSG